jgi:hypothetical protein
MRGIRLNLFNESRGDRQGGGCRPPSPGGSLEVVLFKLFAGTAERRESLFQIVRQKGDSEQVGCRAPVVHTRGLGPQIIPVFQGAIAATEPGLARAFSRRLLTPIVAGSFCRAAGDCPGFIQRIWSGRRSFALQNIHSFRLGEFACAAEAVALCIIALCTGHRR